MGSKRKCVYIGASATVCESYRFCMENCTGKKKIDSTGDVSTGRDHFVGYIPLWEYGQIEPSSGQAKVKKSVSLTIMLVLYQNG
jgi:hypothetical protein